MAVLNLAVDLVERFRRNQVAYRSGQYNETQVRRARALRRSIYQNFKLFPGAQPQSSTDYLSILVIKCWPLYRNLATVSTEHERTLLERQISATDQQIDHLVYAL